MIRTQDLGRAGSILIRSMWVAAIQLLSFLSRPLPLKHPTTQKMHKQVPTCSERHPLLLAACKLPLQLISAPRPRIAIYIQVQSRLQSATPELFAILVPDDVPRCRPPLCDTVACIAIACQIIRHLSTTHGKYLGILCDMNSNRQKRRNLCHEEL